MAENKYDDPLFRSRPNKEAEDPLVEFKENKKVFKEFFTDPAMIGRSITDRTVFGLPKKIYDYKSFDEQAESSYNAWLDPQLDNYFDAIGTHFWDSRSAEESAYRLELLKQKQKDMANPYYAGVMSISELLFDPSSILLLAKPLRVGLLGNTPGKQLSRFGDVLIAEETAKQIIDRERTTADAVMVGTAGFLSKYLGGKLRKYDHRFNEFKYDPSNDRGPIIDMDDIHNSTRTEVGISGLLENEVRGILTKEKLKPKPSIEPNVTQLIKNFKNEFPDIDVYLGNVSKVRSDGKSVPAYYRRSENKLYLDIEGIKDLYKSGRPFEKRYIGKELIVPFKKGDFQSIDEFVNFVMRHEFLHAKIKREVNESRGYYENKINRLAYDEILDERKGIIKKGSSILSDSMIKDQHEKNWYKYEKELFKQMDADNITYAKTGIGIERLSFLSPLDFIINKGNKTAKEMAMNLVQSPMFYKFNFEQFIRSPISAEELRGMEHTNRLRESLEKGYEYLGKYTKRIVGKEPLFKTKIGYRYSKLMTDEQMFSETTYAIWNGYQHSIPEIAQYAAYLRDTFFKPFADDVKKTGLPLIPLIKREDFLNNLNAKRKNNPTVDNVFKNGKVETWTKAEIESAITQNLKDIENVKFDRMNYFPVLYVFNSIAARFTEFESLMRKLLADAKFTPDAINDVIESFKNYEPHAFDKLNNMDNPAENFMLKGSAYSRHLRRRWLGDIDYKPLMDAGFIETNIHSLMSYYFRSVGADLAVTKKYGDPFAYGWFYDQVDGLAPGLEQVAQSYQKKIINAKSKLQQNKLIEERNTALTVLEDMRELVKNRYGLPGNPNSLLFRSANMMKIINNITMLTGFSQIADIGRIITVDGLLKTSRQLFDTFSSGVGKDLFKAAKRDGQLAGQITDMSFAVARAAIISGNDALHTSFKGVEKSFQEINAFYFQYGNLQNPWNYLVKTTASLLGGTKILEKIEKLVLGTATVSDRAFLADLHIGSATAEDMQIANQIYDQYRTHGWGKNANKLGKEYNLIRTGNTEFWTNGDAAMIYRSALNKYIDIIIVTPSLADAPLVANTILGSILFQYKKFGMSYSRRVFNRGLQAKDGHFLSSLAALVAFGMIVDAVRTEQGGRSYSKKTLREKLLDGAERGGIGGMYTDIDRILMALSDNQFGIRPLIGIKKPYGTSLKNKMGAISPTGSFIGNIGEILYDWGRGKHTHHTARRIRKTIPFNNVWYADFLFDKLEKGLY